MRQGAEGVVAVSPVVRTVSSSLLREMHQALAPGCQVGAGLFCNGIVHPERRW